MSSSPLQVLSQLEQYTKYPDFNNYLAYIFADGENLSIEVRNLAAAVNLLAVVVMAYRAGDFVRLDSQAL